jgi:hypothetical protein
MSDIIRQLRVLAADPKDLNREYTPQQLSGQSVGERNYRAHLAANKKAYESQKHDRRVTHQLDKPGLYQ